MKEKLKVIFKLLFLPLRIEGLYYIGYQSVSVPSSELAPLAPSPRRRVCPPPL